MKFCSHCGNELVDEAVVCPKCGCRCESGVAANNRNDIHLAIIILMVISCVSMAIAFLPSLAWTLPMTLSAKRRLQNCEPIGVAFKVCTLLFCNLIAGIILLCIDTEDYIR